MTPPGAAARRPDAARSAAVRTVAIDGPAGAGKSTLAEALARRLGLERLDTGAMYRAVAWAALERGVDPGEEAAVAQLARSLEIELGDSVLVDGLDATTGIRTPAVDTAVSAVAANSEVRTELVRRQRVWVEAHGGGVVEGRDIGSVVLPDADLKIYLTAAPAERAARRAAERGSTGGEHDVAAAMARRDHLDSSRADSPLQSAQQVASDALVIDSTHRSLASILEEVLSWL